MGESMIVTILVLLFFSIFILLSSKAEREVDRYYEEKTKAGRKTR